ncbi:MAG TPA: TetR family transcriptional regulator [Jatrophihabitans sp.]|jgi:AcrR family transcriptional regulator|nr:TetR family transcriptional regulator [Jatrophihabitans sp.]
MAATNRPGPRERLLAAAQQLSYAHGANVGVDALLKEADVARRSLYEHFGGKDGLLAEVLRQSAAQDIEHARAVLDAAGRSPRRRLLALFDDLDHVIGQPGFRGCRYLAADLALAERDHPAHAVAVDYRSQLHELLRAELVRLGHPHPMRAADELHLLIEGALATGATRADARPGRTARALAVGILKM